MTRTESPAAQLGSPCPGFALPGVDGRTWRRKDALEAALLRVVMRNHCSYVQAMDDRSNARGAVRTPECFLFDRDRKLVYRVRLDDNQKPSLGCSLEWKS